MSAGAHQYYEQPTFDQHAENAAVVPFPRSAPDQDPSGPEQALSPKEQEMLDALVAYGRKYESVDFTTTDHTESPRLATAAHSFLYDISERFITRQRAEKQEAIGDAEDVPAELLEDESAPKWFVMSKAPVERRMKEYYSRFGTHRRQKTDSKLKEGEESYLALHKKPTEAVYYTWVMNNGVPEQQVQPRAQRYPEIGLAMQLETVLRKSGHETAADSVEVVLASYGGYFLDRIGGLGHHAVNGRSNIIRIRDDDIPEEQRAENYRPKQM